jgi:hypothetical protein
MQPMTNVPLPCSCERAPCLLSFKLAFGQCGRRDASQRLAARHNPKPLLTAPQHTRHPQPQLHAAACHHHICTTVRSRLYDCAQGGIPHDKACPAHQQESAMDHELHPPLILMIHRWQCLLVKLKGNRGKLTTLLWKYKSITMEQAGASGEWQGRLPCKHVR